MKNKLVFIVLTVFALFAVLATAPSVSATYPANAIYIDPEDSSGKYCENNTLVEVRINASLITGVQTDIYFDPSCVNITDVDFTGTAWSGFFTPVWAHHGDHVILLGLSDRDAPAGDNLFATIRLHCVNTDYCISDLGFSGICMCDKDANLVTISHYNGTFTSETPYVVSSDSSGNKRNTFELTEDVYCYAGNLPASTDVRIYVVANKDVWNDGDVLEYVSGGYETETTESDGSIATTKIWSATLTEGDYDIVVDTNQNGEWNTGEPIDNEVDVGFTAVPEFTTIAIPVAAVFGFVFLMSRRSRPNRRKN